MPLQRIEVSGPKPPKRRQPVIDFSKRFRLQPVHTALRVDRGFHDPGLAQHAQVLRHHRLRHSQPAFDFADRLFRRDQEAQNGATVRLRDEFKDGRHAACIPNTVYTCQGIYAPPMRGTPVSLLALAAECDAQVMDGSRVSERGREPNAELAGCACLRRRRARTPNCYWLKIMIVLPLAPPVGGSSHTTWPGATLPQSI